MSEPPIEWSAILADAVSKPGIISEAYSRFWSYSAGNQLLALIQCFTRGIEPGPLHTFRGWQEIGRSVKRGEKAITLCMPVQVKLKSNEDKATLTDTNEPELPGTKTVTRFIYRNRWFVLAQTDGAPYAPPPIPAWDEPRALTTLAIERVAFEMHNGNVQGYAFERKVAVSPIAFEPERTLFHELAHIVLGHTEDTDRCIDHEESIPRNLREVEAECVALLCSESLGLGKPEFSRGYIQHWLSGQTIPDRSIQRIFKTADAILRAGRPASLPLESSV